MTGPVQQVGVALINWNGYEDTAACLKSLRASTLPPAMILVYDNGSEDGSAERVASEFPEIQVVMGGENRGFCEGNNRAVALLLDAGMELIWVLNNDTKVEPDCLARLTDALDADPDLGAVSAKIWFMDERKPLCYAGGGFDRGSFRACFRGLRELDAGQFNEPGDTEVLSGCCMLIRSEVVRRIGLFNRTFFAYSEDVDWSLRAREAGVRLGYEPRAGLWHKMYGSTNRKGGQGIPKSTPRVEFLLSRNWVIMVRLHTRAWSWQRCWIWLHGLGLRGVSREIGLLLLPGRRQAGWAGLKGLWTGLWLPVNPEDCRIQASGTEQ